MVDESRLEISARRSSLIDLGVKDVLEKNVDRERSNVPEARSRRGGGSRVNSNT